MANETYIFSLCRGILESGLPIEQRIRELSAVLERENRMRLIVCRIFGKRWSHFAGSEGEVVPERRVSLDANWGIVIEVLDADEVEIAQTIEAIKKELEKNIES